MALKRLVAVKKSPLDAYISSSLSGLSTLRAFRMQHASMERVFQLVDEALGPAYALESLGIWMNLRLNLVSILVTLAVAMAASQTPDLSPEYAATIGLALTYTSEIAQAITQLLTFIARFEAEVLLFHIA
jgi:ABC-type multidrug transport system fused ATPase/permease subunit